MREKLEALRGGLDALSVRDRSFAESLLDQADGRGLSDKQWGWVDTLTRRASAPAAKVANVAGIVGMMERADGKRARIAIRVNAELTIRLVIAGPSSSEPGSVVITSTDRGYENRSFYGRVSRNGEFRPGRHATAAIEAAILAALAEMAADPAGVAAKYGHLTGECCFCGLTLTDGPSIAAGYGPVCARNYGLPWGGSEPAQAASVSGATMTPGQKAAATRKANRARSAA